MRLFRLPLLLATIAVLAGCNYKGIPDPQVSARDAEWIARVPKAEDDPRFGRYLIDDPTGEAPGTIVVDTKERQLYLVQPNRKAIRYGVAVGDEAYGWTGTASIARKAEWPDWNPPAEMKARWPHVQYTKGGPDNPARRTRSLSLRGQQGHALSHPRHQRAREDRPRGVLRLHPDAQHRRDRPLQPRSGEHEGHRPLEPLACKREALLGFFRCALFERRIVRRGCRQTAFQAQHVRFAARSA